MFIVLDELEKKKKELKSTVTLRWPAILWGYNLRAQSCYWLEPYARGSQQLWIQHPSIYETFDQHLNIFKLLFFFLLVLVQIKHIV